MSAKRTMSSIVEAHMAGDSANYELLVAQCQRLAIATVAPIELAPIIAYVTPNMDGLNVGTCRRLVGALLGANWANLNGDQLKNHADFIYTLCMTCPQHLHAAVESLIGRFIIDDRDKCIDSGRQSMCDDQIHHTIERLLIHVPALSMGSSVLVKQLSRQFPHTAGSTTKVRRYTLNAIRMTMYVPTLIKQEMFSIIVDRLVMMDTSVKRQAAAEDTQFETDESVEAYSEEAHEREGFPCTCAHRSDQRLTLDLCMLDMCRFMDACLTGMIPLRRDTITDVPGWSNGRVVYEWFALAFDQHVLPAFDVSLVPSLWLALCAQDKTVFVHHLDLLWSRVVNASSAEQSTFKPCASSSTRRKRQQSTSGSPMAVTTSQHAVCHLASIVARAAVNAPVALCTKWMQIWKTHMDELCDTELDDTPTSAKNGIYFALCHALAYVLVNRSSEMEPSTMVGLDLHDYPQLPLQYTTVDVLHKYIALVHRVTGTKINMPKEYQNKIQQQSTTRASSRYTADPFVPIFPYAEYTLERSGAILGQLYRLAATDVDDDAHSSSTVDDEGDDGDEGMQETTTVPVSMPLSMPLHVPFSGGRRMSTSSGGTSITHKSVISGTPGDFDYVMGSFQRGTTPVL